MRHLELYLIGTCHSDLEGRTRLRKLLDRISPDHVAIESDYDGAVMFENLEHCLGNLASIEELIKSLQESDDKVKPETVRALVPIVGFEFFVSRDWAIEKDRGLILADAPHEINTDGVIEVFTKSLEEVKLETQITYDDDKLEVPEDAIVSMKMNLRDKFTEQTLRPLSGKVVYVGGIRHIFGDYTPNLYDRLRDLIPQRIRLSEADSL